MMRLLQYYQKMGRVLIQKIKKDGTCCNIADMCNKMMICLQDRKKSRRKYGWSPRKRQPNAFDNQVIPHKEESHGRYSKLGFGVGTIVLKTN